MRKLITVLVSAVAFVSSSAGAAVIYSNFIGASGFGSPGFVTIWDVPPAGPAAPPSDLDWAARFTVTGSSYVLDTIRVPVGWVIGPANELDVMLMSDSSGLPGAVIESFHFSGAMTPVTGGGFSGPGISGFGSILTATSSLNPLLAEGADYWIALSAGPGPDDSVSRWHISPTTISGASRSDSGPWTATSVSVAFDVNGTTGVPVAGSLPLLLVGLAAVVAAIRRRSPARSVAGFRRLPAKP